MDLRFEYSIVYPIAIVCGVISRNVMLAHYKKDDGLDFSQVIAIVLIMQEKNCIPPEKKGKIGSYQNTGPNSNGGIAYSGVEDQLDNGDGEAPDT